MKIKLWVLSSTLWMGVIVATLNGADDTSAGTIVLVTNNATTDADLISHLDSLGHSVTTGAFAGIDTNASELATLNAADLVLVSRNTSSGDYNGAAKIAAWDGVTSPILLGNPYLVRTNRWSWVDTEGLNLDYSGDISAPIGTATVHPFLEGVTTSDGSGDPAISGLSKYNPSTDSDVPAPGAVLGDGVTIAVTNDADLAEQRVYLASWQAGQTTGSGNLLGGNRYFYAMPEFNITAMNPSGFQILNNVVGLGIQVPEPTTLLHLCIALGFLAIVTGGREFRSRGPSKS